MEDVKITTLGEVVPDMERYLENDCYCPGEVYQPNGFFFTIFNAKDKCRLIEQSDKHTAVITLLDSEHPDVMVIWHDDEEQPGRVMNAQIIDATENNIKFAKEFVSTGELPNFMIDEFKKGSTEKALKELFDIADAVMVS